MKKLNIYIILILTISCHSPENKTLKILNDGMETATREIWPPTDLIVTEFQKAMYENPLKIKIYKQKVDSLRLVQCKIDSIISSVKREWITKNDTSNIPLTKPIKFNRQALIDELLKYKKILSLYSYIPELKQINEDFNLDFYRNEKFSLASLTIFSNKITYSTFRILKQIYSKIEPYHFEFNKYEAVVIQKSRKVAKGQFLESEIFLTLIDTIGTFQVVIDNDTIQSKNGKAIYRKTANKLGKNTYSGILLLKAPSTGEILSYPFKSDYTVIDK